MPFVGITPPAGGIPPERRTERERKVRRVQQIAGVERPVDEAELSSVERAHRDGAIQGETSEEGHEDRQTHDAAPTYQPAGSTLEASPPPKKIDIEG